MTSLIQSVAKLLKEVREEMHVLNDRMDELTKVVKQLDEDVAALVQPADLEELSKETELSVPTVSVPGRSDTVTTSADYLLKKSKEKPPSE